MALSTDLVRQFARITNDNTSSKNKSDNTLYGTAVEYNGAIYVKMDGSDSLTPVETTTVLHPGERVVVTIKNHSAIVTGNATNPSPGSAYTPTDEDRTNVGNSANNVAGMTFLPEAILAMFEDLFQRILSMGYMTEEDVKEFLKDIEYIEAEIGKFGNLTADQFKAVTAEITNLKGYIAEFTYLSAEVLSAIKANIKEANIKYANIDFANIGEAAIKKLFAESGIIDDLVMSEGHVTGKLVGVEIVGDLIKAGTLKADRLIVRGTDGNYYSINQDFTAVPGVEPIPEDSIHGSILVAESVTAEKVMVDDLVAFDATIAGFNITNEPDEPGKIYSGVKSSIDNSTRGIYLDNTGQVLFGDTNNYLKYYKDTDGTYKLNVRASAIKLGAGGTDVETVVSKAITSSIEEFYQSTSATELKGGSWSTTQPTWTEGTYIWRRTLVTYGDNTTGYTPSENGVCITGNTGPAGSSGKGVSKTEVFYYLSTSNTTQTGGSWVTTPPTWVDGRYYWQKIKTTFTDGTSSESTPVCVTGAKGSNGGTGATGTGVSSITTEFYLSTSKTTQTGGSWITTMPEWSSGKYLWTRSKIVYTNPSSTVYTTPICDSSWEAVNNVSVGGRNLLSFDRIEYNGATIIEGDSTQRLVLTSSAQYDGISIPSTLFELNSEYVLQYDLTLVSGAGSVGGHSGIASTAELYVDGVYCGNYANGTNLAQNKKVHVEVFIKTGSTVPESSPNVYIQAQRLISSPIAMEHIVENLKLEKGNKSTSWTPSVEDVNKGIDDATETANNANAAAADAQANILILDNKIQNLVIGKDGQSLMEQTENGWSFNMKPYLDRMDATDINVSAVDNKYSNIPGAVDGLRADMDDVTAYVTVSNDNANPYILLGSTASQYKVRITNTSIDFTDDQSTEPPAYIRNVDGTSKFMIDRAEITSELQYGDFVWSKRENGNMGLTWRGVTS